MNWSISIRVRTLECKIVSLSPHAFSREVQIETLFAFVNSIRRCLSWSMIKFFNICHPFILQLYVFKLVFKYFPQFSILNSLDLINFDCRHCYFKPPFNVYPFLSLLLDVDNLDIHCTLNKTKNIIPMRRELILFYFLDKLCQPQLYLSILEANYFNARRSPDAYVEKILILRIVLLQMSKYSWNHWNDIRSLVCDNGEKTSWIICSVFQIVD